ncbi:hypothetical protein QTL97_12060 [Sporosarcina thermotolerans]|uniref:Uncharacterized protein n=1 Tax=Sporosarcina thermotolerans TaxID=633404 RepID=A0AAW9A9E5_9BACL|nr:hypothetical protein [Sporosarcina thermotolerans]MDW0117674.1 hypothetical protein [Sporosarcina thermotolerans]WHT49235.1 hypothetical protein QNH10_06340 [Sporosarcina thermotolerans]
MHYWYFPYSIHEAYPLVVQQVTDPLAVRENSTASPSDPNPYPPVQTTRFTNSAKHSLDLIKQAELLIKKISESETFAHELMTSAQQSNQKKVDEMCTSAGITAKFETKYTPDGFRIQLQEEDDKGGVCCKVILNLRW